MPTAPRPELSLRVVVLLTATVVAAGTLSLAIVNLTAGDGDSTVDLTAQQASSDEQYEVVVDVTVPLLAPGELSTTTEASDGETAGTVAASGQATAGAVKGRDAEATAPAPAAKTPAPATALPAAPAAGTPTTGAPATAPVSSTEYKYYSFPGVAPTIVIALHDGNKMEFWSASPAAGWGFFVEKATGSVIEIGFETTSGPEQEGEFVARLSNGKISVSHFLESEGSEDEPEEDEPEEDESDD